MIACGRRRGVRFADSWYTTDLGGGSADIVRYFGLPEPLGGGECSEFTTIWIDLTRGEDELLSCMSPSTRYNIRKAGSYNLKCESWHRGSEEALEPFVQFFDPAMAAKGQPPADRARLLTYARAGILDVSRTSSPTGEALVWQTFYRDSFRACQLQSASIFRSQPDSAFRTYLGRANRYLCWQNMIRFKRDGIRVFDFGGWYPGSENKELLAVNEFKEGFGGRIVKNWECTRAETALGRAYLAGVRLRRRMASL